VFHHHFSSQQVKDLLHIDEEMLINLSHGRVTELTIEHLFRYLNILGRDLDVVVFVIGIPLAGVFLIRLPTARCANDRYWG
jgi:hypothetical protein